jgi:hypothetical protein
MPHIKSLTTTIVLVFFGHSAVAGTDLETAVENGGEVLAANDIAKLIVGKVVTARMGEKTFRFYYDPDNILQGELANGGWQGSGAYAITDNDQVCVSMAADKGRYRCLTVVRNGETVQKFNVNGKMTFELLDFEPSTGL